MIKLIPDPTFEAEVEITVPGQKEKGTIPLTFKYRGEKELQKWVDKNSAKKDEDDNIIKEGKTTRDVFFDFVVGWGLEEEFNKKNVEIFFDNYRIADVEIFQAYGQLLVFSRIKN